MAAKREKQAEDVGLPGAALRFVTMQLAMSESEIRILTRALQYRVFGDDIKAGTPSEEEDVAARVIAEDSWIPLKTVLGPIALDLVRTMGQDNGINYRERMTDLQRVMLNAAVIHCQRNGLEFTEEQIEQIATGEERETAEQFEGQVGYAELSAVLNGIFEGGAQ